MQPAKLPPQAPEIEEAVLGALMLQKDAIASIADFLLPDAFYRNQHQDIYTAILRLYKLNQPIDIITVTNALRQSGKLVEIGGPSFILGLSAQVASAANIEQHAQLICQKHMLRRLAEIGGKMQRHAFEEMTDPLELLNQSESELNRVTEGALRQQDVSVSESLMAVTQEIETAGSATGGVTGIPSGFREIDAITHGWQPADLIIIAARPGMGKTSAAMQLARNAAVQHQKPVGVFSLEQSHRQLTKRLASLESGISHDKLLSGNMKEEDWRHYHSATAKLTHSVLRIDDTPGITIAEMRAKARRMQKKYGIQLLVIDYLQLINGLTHDRKGANREQEISYISRSLKGIAKELNIPVIALSQLSRSVESRSDKRPLLSDLRESGSIEQDADQVILLYRHEYYNLMEDENGNSTAGQARWIIAKNRHGRTAEVKLGFTGHTYSFS